MQTEPAAQELRIEEKGKDAMWMRIAKAVDTAMAAELPGKIERYQVEYIINAISKCRTLPRSHIESQPEDTGPNYIINSGEETPAQSLPPSNLPTLPNRPQTWATVAV